MTYRRLRRRLALRLLPRRVWCAVTTGGLHRWGTADPVIIDGPIDLPPREREWIVFAFHKQCDRCYKVAEVPHTEEEAASAIEEAIREEEEEET